MKTRVGFAGLGDIGLPIATRIHEILGPIALWNRTPAKADSLVRSGAQAVMSPQALAEASNLIGLCLTSDDAVEEVVFGTDGVLAGFSEGREATIVNLSTGVPRRSKEFAERVAAAKGVRWLDAPVSGGVAAATRGELTLFLGGDRESVLQAQPLLEAIGRRWTLMGPPGAGQITKLCNQMIVATNLLAIAEAISVGRKAGINVSQLAEALRGGFADSMPLQIFGPRMADRVHEPRLGAIRLMLKDIDAARSVSADSGVSCLVSDFVANIYRSSADVEGLSLDDDLSAIVKVFEDL